MHRGWLDERPAGKSKLYPYRLRTRSRSAGAALRWSTRRREVSRAVPINHLTTLYQQFSEEPLTRWARVAVGLITEQSRSLNGPFKKGRR